MKSYTVLIRNGGIISRHVIAARDLDWARWVAVNRFGGVLLAILPA